MKMKVLSYIVVAFLVTFFVGCSEKSAEPLEPIGNKFKFEKINLNFTQTYFPKTKTYQSREDVERKLNEEITKNLKINNLIDNNSTEELVIIVDLKRIFQGEDLPFESMRTDTIGSPRLGYDIKIIKNGKILRSLVRTNLIYDAGFFKNIKHIAMLDEANERENGAIEALGKDIVEQIKDFK
ncbi:hypothetical protein O8C79_06100 [Aliarcobacter butzleri]|uniref:hypothetical protein n=1 Tax=Aliarcobacter butzleri TaxID=28197 RepID=UPI00263C3F09|nr:hypothetical protein [Aliarcobacter butzleri]MDN5104862.1 hypothetical protein [Aliarcobacter butzleri]